jgi:hypothetical protein
MPRPAEEPVKEEVEEMEPIEGASGYIEEVPEPEEPQEDEIPSRAEPGASTEGPTETSDGGEFEPIVEPEADGEIADDAMGDIALPEESVPDALELDDEPEDIWGDEKPETENPRFGDESAVPHGAAESAPASESQSNPGEESGDREKSGEPEEPLLGEPTARLLEYLKGLADELPPEKKEEFDVLGLKEKLDDLIGKIKGEAERSKEPPPVLQRESGYGLLSSVESLRVSDPRRSALGRRSGTERRRDERRKSDERRDSADRRAGERRGPVPEIKLGERVRREAAPVKVAPDGTPTEIAGIAISPRMAKLIQLMRQEKKNGR